MATLTEENLSAIGAAAGEAMANAAKAWDSCSSAANEALGNVNMKDTSELAAYRTPSKAVLRRLAPGTGVDACMIQLGTDLDLSRFDRFCVL